MAFSGESEILTWQRVEIALRNVSPAAQMAFRGLKSWMAGHKAFPNLQFTAFDHTTNGSDGTNADTVVTAGASTVLAVYAKKNTGSTAAYLKLSNHATAIQAQGEVILRGIVPGIEVFSIYPHTTGNANGMAMATGIVLATVTTYNGTTHSLIADSFDGFVVTAA